MRQQLLSTIGVFLLAAAAMAIKKVFGGKDQDIEWAYLKGQIFIVQSRPFIAGG